MGQHLAWIHEVLEQDKQEPKKQRHTAKRIVDRLRAEKGYPGGYTVVKEAVRAWKDATKEVFVPLSHPPGEAQVDFGFAYVDVAGERQVTKEFQRLQSHYLFETQFCLVRRGREPRPLGLPPAAL